MAATPKHKRSTQKARKTRASDRYSKIITLARKTRKFGGTLFQVNKEGEPFKSHTVSSKNKTYKNIKVID
jgi:ribosomal protein L32